MQVVTTEGNTSIDDRVWALPWGRILASLHEHGHATIPALLTYAECQQLADTYADDAAFRSTVVMSRHGFGRGEYRYFDYPLPESVAGLRESVYPQLVSLANQWQETLGLEARFPTEHGEFLRRCHESGQKRPTPLLLRYGADDYNCLHQDVYGEHVFPIQMAVLLSEPGEEFSGGEFLLTEQRPRMQSRAEVVPLARGDAVLFAVRHRPAHGARGPYRVAMKHGVSRLRWGRRHTLGVIFHDAE